MAGDNGRERSICKGGPLTRRVYWTDELAPMLEREAKAGRDRGYVRTDRFVRVDEVFATLGSGPKSPPSERALASAAARVWIHQPH